LYPYDALPFATLYFTGGKYFNRSMRQFAKSEFNWKLDDKGIKDRRTNKNIDFDPPLKTEHDVFRALGLVYKRPADRKFFDDVEPIDKFNR
jgi:DNA polymerase/3'-5' exonuclease PolX